VQLVLNNERKPGKNNFSRSYVTEGEKDQAAARAIVWCAEHVEVVFHPLPRQPRGPSLLSSRDPVPAMCDVCPRVPRDSCRLEHVILPPAAGNRSRW
jgi:hypothetical protein